jgi:hypothetical protein
MTERDFTSQQMEITGVVPKENREKTEGENRKECAK